MPQILVTDAIDTRHARTHAHTHTHTHTHSLSLSHTHTLSFSLTHKHTQMGLDPKLLAAAQGVKFTSASKEEEDTSWMVREHIL